MGATELAEAIRARLVSADDVVEAHLLRLEAVTHARESLYQP
jgi:Asp-tRNA(Asn)/Glu-tRNA(Gln) amidotransferase A subunit family amidase